jgi:hypothetical protein
LEGYACTEAGNMAMQSWNYKGMVFFPDNSFLEFIPMAEHQKSDEDPTYQPKTVLYDELDLGLYELVLSNFNGGILVRYRIGDIFEVIANEDKEVGSKLPQVKFYSRSDDIIDLGGFIRLTERDIWKTIEATGLEYQDWVAVKDTTGTYPSLHLYLELKKPDTLTKEKAQEMVRQAFSARYGDYNDMKEILNSEPLTVTLLPSGAFAAYMKEKAEAGADLAHLKPPHMKPPDDVLRKLVTIVKEQH